MVDTRPEAARGGWNLFDTYELGSKFRGGRVKRDVGRTCQHQHPHVHVPSVYFLRAISYTYIKLFFPNVEISSTHSTLTVLELVKSVKSPISNGRCIVASICFTVQRSSREGSECKGEEDWDKSDWMYARTPDVMGLPRAAKALRVICIH